MAKVDLAVTGMTCTSCAARVERRLNRLPGVSATVNFATETAQIDLPDGLTVSDLVRAVEETGYGALPLTEVVGPEAEVRSMRRRFYVCLVLAIPVFLLAMIPPLQFTGWLWVACALTTPIVTWGAWPFHRAAAINLRHGAATMDTLISVGVLAAYVWSLWAMFLGGALDAPAMGSMAMSGPETYFEVAAVVPVFILAGRWFEMRAKYRATSALRALMDLSVPEVTVLRDGVQHSISADALAVGDVFVVRPGDRIATDGLVVDGDSAVDESLLTGESMPVAKSVGSAVSGGTVNADGMLAVEATHVGGDTRLAQIARLVVSAQMEKAPVQRLADRISAVFVPVVIAIALVTLALWWIFSRDVQSAFTAAVAVLIIACPCALGLATPIALLVGTGRGAQMGILIRGPQVLEDTRRVDTIVLDKTGTITTGEMAVQSVLLLDPGFGAAEVMQRLASLEAGSEHPVARAIVTHARHAYGVTGAEVVDFASERGSGVAAKVDGLHVWAGRPDWVAEWVGADYGDELRELVETEMSGTRVAVGWSGRVIALIDVSDSVRPTSARAIDLLRADGLRPVMVTGDNNAAAARIAASVGIVDVIADVRPEQKVAEVEHLMSQGNVVAMIGDGVNDAAALARADLGISMGSGSDVAVEASDLTLINADLLTAVDAIRLSRRTLRIIRGNLFWAFAYNIAMIPIAASGLLNPMFAGAAMAFSSVFVVANSLRLRRFTAVPR